MMLRDQPDDKKIVSERQKQKGRIQHAHQKRAEIAEPE